jgi:HEAT repeat protein
MVKTMDEKQKLEKSGNSGDENMDKIEMLVGLLKHSHAKERKKAAKMLGKLGDVRAVPALIDMYFSGDNSRYVKESIFEALCNMENAVVEHMIDRLKKYPYELKSGEAPKMFDLLSRFKSKSSVPKIIEFLEDPHRVRCEFDLQAAARALGKIGDESAVPILIEKLWGATDVAAAYALGQIGDPSAVPALKRGIENRSLYASKARINAILMIGGLSAVNALTECLISPSSSIRDAAADGLISLQEEFAVQIFVERLGWNEDTTRTLHRALVKIGKPAVPALVRKFMSANNELQERMAFILGDIGDPAAIAPIKEGLLKAEIGESAALALSLIKDPSAENALKQALKDKKPEVRVQVLRYADVRSQIRALGDENRGVQQKAMNLLGKGFVQKPILRAMNKAIEARDSQMYESLMSVLRRIGTPSAVTNLSKALLVDDEDVRRTVGSELKCLLDSSAEVAEFERAFDKGIRIAKRADPKVSEAGGSQIADLRRQIAEIRAESGQKMSSVRMGSQKSKSQKKRRRFACYC